MAGATTSRSERVLSITEVVLKWGIGIFLMLTVGLLLGSGREVPPRPDDQPW